MNRYRKNCFIVWFIASFLASMISRPIISFAWGDSTYLEGGKTGEFRTLYKLADINNGALGDKITFNSITDVASTGDERNFVSAQEATADGYAVDPHGTWTGNNITVEDGKEYVVRLYVHNNNPNATAGVSTGTKVAISGIGQSTTNKDGKQEVEVNGFIESDNATPKEYWDYIRFNSNTSFHLDYVYGSAMIYNHGAVGTTDRPVTAAQAETMTEDELNAHEVTGCPLSDDIVFKQKADGTLDGQLIGFDALDGNLPGCYAYSTYITIRVKAVYDYEFATEVKVRKVGTKGWNESINAQVGEQLEFQIEYNNTGTQTQDNVMICDVLPGNLEYVPDTTILYNYSTKDQWATLTPDGDIVTRGVNIGSYVGSPNGQDGGNAFIRFKAKVVDTDLEYGSNKLVNWGQASVSSATQVGYAVVEVHKSAYFVIIVLSMLLIFSIICSIVLIRKIKKLN